MALAAIRLSPLSQLPLPTTFNPQEQRIDNKNSPSGSDREALGELEASPDALLLKLLMLLSSSVSNDGADAEADAVAEATAAPSFLPPVLPRPPRRVRLRTCDEEPALSSCLPPCSGRVGRVSEGCWEEDEAEAEAATALVARRPNGGGATTTLARGVAAAALAPPMQEPTREAPRAACRGAIRRSGICFLAEGERASSKLLRELEFRRKKMMACRSCHCEKSSENRRAS